jgi:phosphotransferase system enzyme I (PtsI)
VTGRDDLRHVHGLAVARGIAIGRAVLVASSRVDVAHYFISPTRCRPNRARAPWAQRRGRGTAAPAARHAARRAAELAALLDVHLMLLQDEMLTSGVKHWITERLYNAEWALTTQLEVIARQFDEMEDEYLRERKADLEQVVERILRYMKGVACARGGRRRPAAQDPARPAAGRHRGRAPGAGGARPVARRHAAVQAKRVRRFVTDVGGKTSHTAIVARSMDIPGRGGRARGQPAGAPGRLGHHRRRCRAW